MSEILSEGAIVTLIMLMFYMSVGTLIERYHLNFGHEASLTILLGMIVSFFAFYQNDQEFIRLLKFSDSTFFYICMPPIVFASGFNMQRGNFFGNLKNIMTFGILGTFVGFFCFSLMTISIKNLNFMQQIDGKTGIWKNLELTSSECLLMCSLLCSSDVIAAISLISYEQEPTLFSIVFGEGILNDAVSIILFNTVMKYTSKNSVINISTPFEIIKEFISLGFGSVLIGIIFGLLSSYILKTFRAFSKNPVTESMMIFCFGYLSYVVSEVAQNSGIITLLTCGIVMAHYTWYNLSPQGKQSSFIVFQCLGYANEAFVFSYLGLTFFSYFELEWSPHLFLVELAVIVIGRLISTIGLIYFLTLFGYKSGITFKQLVFIWYSGMIRGAIAFGLVLRIDSKEFANRGVIVTTSLSLVVFTTVVFGSTVGLLQKALFQQKDDDSNKSSNVKTLINASDHGEQDQIEAKQETENNENDQKDDEFESYDLSASDQKSEYETILHPNEERKQGKRVYRGCAKYLNRFDELIMKPIFIYNYEKKMQKKSKEFFNLFMKQGKLIEEEFAQNYQEKEIREQSLKMVQFVPNDDHSRLSSGQQVDLRQSNIGFSVLSRQFSKVKRKIQKQRKNVSTIQQQQNNNQDIINKYNE